jgi:hypothetical protein
MKVSGLRNYLGCWVLGALMLVSSSGGADAETVQARRGVLVERLFLTGELVAEEAVYLLVPNARIWPMRVRWLAEDGIEVAAKKERGSRSGNRRAWRSETRHERR